MKGFCGDDIVPFNAKALGYARYQVVVGRAIDEIDAYSPYRTEPKRSVLMELIHVWASCGKPSKELLASLREWEPGEVTVALFLLGHYVSSDLADLCKRELEACQQAA